MEEDIHRYWGESITVTYDVNRCIHAAECVRGLPDVFDTGKRPWVELDHSDPDEVADVILRCPTGALHFEQTDDGDVEPVPESNEVTVVPDGPLYLRGDIEIVTTDDTVLLEDTRVALCRCGASSNMPLCDNSHIDSRFDASEPITANDDTRRETPETGVLRVTPQPNGPNLVEGLFELTQIGDEASYREADTELCRCGGSGHKPFCDGTHEKIGFTSGE